MVGEGAWRLVQGEGRTLQDGQEALSLMLCLGVRPLVHGLFPGCAHTARIQQGVLCRLYSVGLAQGRSVGCTHVPFSA